MSTVPPPGAQPPQPPPSTAQAALTAVVRDPSPDVARLATGTRVEGTVLPQQPAPQTQTPASPTSATQVETSRAAVQALQTAVDSAKADAASRQRADAAAAQRTEAAATQKSDAAAAQRAGPQAQTQQTPQPTPAQQAPQVTVRTPVGDVTLRTPLPIPEGARLTFEIANTSNNQVTVRLATLNGQPVQQALVQLAADRAAAPPPSPSAPALPPASGVLAQSTALPFGQAWTPSGALPLAQAGPLNAFVLLGNAAPSQPLGQLPGQPQAQTGFITGSDLTIRITSVAQATPGVTPPQGPAPGILGTITPGTAQQSLTQGGPTPAGATSVPGQPGAQASAGSTLGPAAPTAAGQTASTAGAPSASTAASAGTANLTPQPTGPGSLLPSGSAAQQGLRLIGSQGWPLPPFTTPSQVQQTPVRLALTGIVTAQSTAAQTVIQTPDGTVQLGSRVNLPPGTTVTLDVLNQTAPRTDAAGTPVHSAAPPPSAGVMPFAAGTAWPALSEALQVLQRSDPQAAQLLANTIPDGGPRTVVAALSFIQAMRAGDARQWPGDNSLRALERSGPRGAHLARALAGETAQLGAQVRETAGEWRSTPVPWNANGQIEKINLITRREEAKDDDENSKAQKGSGPGLRFLLDLDFSNLGSLQLDGMVHEETNGFDMILRSHETLDDDIRRDLTGLFVSSVQAVGLKGGLSFQVTKKFADPVGASEPKNLERDGVWA